MSCKLYWTPELLFFASKLFVLETIVEHRFELLPRDLSSCCDSLLPADLLCI